MKRVFFFLLALLIPSALAFSVTDALNNIRTAAEDITDGSLLLSGRLYDVDGSIISLELDIMLIPGEELMNVFIFQPDALADNMLVLDGDTIASYTFLTHQVTLFDASDPNALGSIIPAAEGSARPLDLSLDITRLFAEFHAELVAGTADSTEIVLRFTAKQPGAVIQAVDATVATSTWLPTALRVEGEGDHLFAELWVSDVQVNPGLSAAELRELPFDAEIIDRRATP